MRHVLFGLATILGFCASSEARAQVTGRGVLTGEVVAYVQATPLCLEPSAQSPIVAVIPHDTKLTLLGYEVDESATRIESREKIVSDNMYFKVKYGEIEGYVSRYYLQTNATVAKATGNTTDDKKSKVKGGK